VSSSRQEEISQTLTEMIHRQDDVRTPRERREAKPSGSECADSSYGRLGLLRSHGFRHRGRAAEHPRTPEKRQLRLADRMGRSQRDVWATTRTSVARWCSALVLLALLAACASSPTPMAPTASPTPPSSTLPLTIAPVPSGLAPYNRDDWKLWTDAEAKCRKNSLNGRRHRRLD
jgi:hypothetical protein